MASPHPDKELDRLQQLCTKELPPVVVLSGVGEWFRTQAVDKVLQAVPAKAELITIDGQATSISGLGSDDDGGDADDGGEPSAAAHCEELQPLAGGGLFASRTFVVVRRGDRWLRRHAGAVAAFLPRIHKGSVLVVETQKLDKRTRFAKQLDTVGAVFDFRDLYETPFGRPDRPLEGELVQWVLSRARTLQVPLAPESALLLTSQVGKHPGDLIAELTQLRDRLGEGGGKKPLQPDDLRGKLSCSFESTPFEFAEAMLANDRRRALRSLHAMFARGVKQRDGRRMDTGGLFPFATSWLFTTTGQVLEGRMHVDEGKALRDVAGLVGVRGFTDRYEEQVRTNPRQRLEHGLLSILHCQRERRLLGEDDLVLLERLLARWFDGAPIPAAQDLEW